MNTPAPLITAARITAMPQALTDPMPQVWVTVDGQESFLFQYYPDELHFTPQEFVGLTLKAAHALFHKKDVDYLQS